MKSKIIFSLLATLLFLIGVFFVLKNKNSLPYLQIDQNQNKTSLIEAPRYSPPFVTAEEMSKVVELKGGFGKDQAKVYWWGFEILNVDVNSFDTFDDNYAHDKNQIYFQGFALGDDRENVFIIQGADLATFTPLGNGYAKDKDRVYYKGGEIEGADPATFEVLELINVTYYAKDKHHMYFQNERIDSFDTPTLRILEGSRFSSVFLADKNKVALGGLSEEPSDDKVYKFEVKTIEGADPSSFVVLDGIWGKDARAVFYGTQIVPGADSGTFQILGTSDSDFAALYGKDKDNVYYLGKRLEGVDTASFRAVENVTLTPGNFGEDKYSAYKDGEAFPKQDLRSFQAGRVPLSAKNLGGNYYLYRDHIYHYSPPFQAGAYFAPVYAKQYTPERVLADVTTFQVLKDSYARDKEYVYYEGGITLTHDPGKTFVVLSDGYSKTSSAVFLSYFMINGALPDSFQVLSLGYAKDAQSVFYGDQRVEGADPMSFKILGRGLSSDIDDWSGERSYYNYARDISKIFCEEFTLDDADQETFTLKGKNGMPQDKFRQYDGCEAKE